MRLTRNHTTPDPAAAYHVASLVVHCRPELLADIVRQIEATDGLSVPQSDPLGKMVVLIEAADEGYMTRGISLIEQLPGVASTNLIFHQIDR
jgi:nitrate reductase NapD